MDLADELLAVANRLQTGDTEGDWRRSASSSYYAVFRRVVDDALSLVISPSVPRQLYSRSIGHKRLVSCAEAFKAPNNLPNSYGFNGTVSTDLTLVATNVAILYAFRVKADYRTEGFAKTTAEQAFTIAEQLFAATARLKTSNDGGYVCFLAGALLREPQKDPS